MQLHGLSSNKNRSSEEFLPPYKDFTFSQRKQRTGGALKTNLENRDMNIAISLRNFTVLMACLLLASACAPQMEQLIKEAHDTGDWSRVEKRQETLLARQARKTPMCPTGMVSTCNGWGKLTEPKCVCVDRSIAMRAVQR